MEKTKMDVKNLLREFCSAVEQHDGQRLAQLFCEDGVYHDVFYGAFAGRERITELIDVWFYKDADDFLKFRARVPLFVPQCSAWLDDEPS
jgi:hypothetical protein